MMPVSDHHSIGGPDYRVKEIKVHGHPALQFTLRQPLPEPSHIHLCMGMMATLTEPVEDTEPEMCADISFSPGVIAVVWMIPEQLVERVAFMETMKEAGGKDWTAKVTDRDWVASEFGEGGG